MVVNLDGKIALITGSSSGIGAQTAVLFSSLGAQVVIVGRRQDQLDRVAREVTAKSPKKYEPLVVNADFEKEEDVKKVIDETIAKHSRLDILVNNAGLFNRVEFGAEGYLEDFDRVMKVNVRPALQLSHLARPYLKEAKGSIVNVSSIVSTKVYRGCLTYALSKAAVDMMTKGLAFEFAPEIRVNSVNPGVVKTDFLRDHGGSDELYGSLKELNPLKKAGEPIEIANIIAFLSSNASTFMTGSIVFADGGALVDDPYSAGV